MISTQKTNKLQALIQNLPGSHPLIHPERSILHVLVDSRQLTDAASSIFFALKGARTNGHHFIPDLYQKGLRVFVIDQAIEGTYPDADFIQVEDVLTSLQTIVAWHRSQLASQVIGITGSNGKTIVKEWLVELLHKQNHQLAYSPRSYNSQLGVPLSVWRLSNEKQIGIFEAGISTRNEMDKLRTIIQPTIGIFTNLGTAHDEGFTSQEEKLKEKLKLFQQVDCLIYRADDERIENAVKQLGVKTISWALDSSADIKVSRSLLEKGRQRLCLHWAEQEYCFELPFSDLVAMENAIHCAVAILQLRLNLEDFLSHFAQLPSIGLRMEVLAGRDGSTLLNDSYSNDLTSLGICLNFAQEQSRQQALSLILSDIPQSGLAPQELYRRAALLIKDRLSQFIGVGEEVKHLANYLPDTIDQHYFANTNELLQNWANIDFSNRFIILKGARYFAFERLLSQLQARVHRAVLEVDLGALVSNYRYFKQQIAPQTAIAAMVKAAAYGSGSLEVARRLEVEQVDYLVVAYTDEGVTLRKGGIQTPILVLNVDTTSFSKLVEYGLEPEIYDLGQLAALAYFTDSLEKPMKIHIKINSGMNRLGFESQDISLLKQTLLNHPQLRVATVLSHLAASDDAQEDNYTHQQVAIFEKAYQDLVASLSYHPARHILNTSGILRFPQYQYEMVRLGIGLYGLEASATAMDQLKLVLTLKARVSQVRSLKSGETIGYGRKGVIVEENSRIATLNIGYADGLPRSTGNGQYAVAIHGHLAPTIGAICMDMCMVDVSHLPRVQAGDEAIIFGPRPSVGDLAAVDNTIDYEILTRISERVLRRYIQE